MDTSKEYIKMRIKAIPFLGKGVSPRIPDASIVYYCEYSVRNDAFGNYFVQDNSNTKDYICILERQDQLQEMLNNEDFIELNHAFQFFWERVAQSIEGDEILECGKTYYLWHSGFRTAEQLWLAYVMYKLHNKTWNGEDWV